MTVKSETIRPLIPPQPGVIPGMYYISQGLTMANTSITITAGRAHYQPIFLPGIVDTMTMEVTTGAAGAARLGIYRDSGGLPGALLQDFGTIDTTSNAVLPVSFTALRLPWDWVWMCSVFNATPGMRAATGGIASVAGQTSTSAGHRGYIATLAYDVLPATAALGSFTSSANVPLMFLSKS